MSTQSSTQRLKIDTATLQQQQLNAAEDPEGSDIELTTGNVDEDYEFPTHEQHLMHIRLSKKVNDPIKKEYHTVETIWQGAPAQYNRMSETREKGGNDSFSEYDSVEILHDVRASAKPVTRTASSTPTGDSKKPLRSLKDAQARFLEIVGSAAPENKSFTELKEAIAHLESEAGAADLAELKEKLAAQ
ncbi:MAG TPA: hypothetical protein VF690_12315 [Hymenobacter sp.]|jgi:hypothetical protein